MYDRIGFPSASQIALAFLALAALAAPASAQTPTTPNLGAYLTQWQCQDGSPPGSPTCRSLAVLHDTDPLFFQRSDGYQLVSSVEGNGFWETTFENYPHGAPFSPANGCGGGNIYRYVNGMIYITDTQDCSLPTMQVFNPPVPLFDEYAPACPQWRDLGSGIEECHGVITFPASGFGETQITSDCIVSAHYTTPIEVNVMCPGWGELLWEAYNPTGTAVSPTPAPLPGMPAIATTWPLTGHRLWTQLVAQTPSIRAANWPPGGAVP